MKFSETLAEIFRGLDKREADILQRRYGLLNRQPESLQAIADDYSLTRERVRQVQNRSLSLILPKLQRHPDVEALTRVATNYLGKLKVKRLQTLLSQLRDHYRLDDEPELNVIGFLLRYSPKLSHAEEDEHFHHFVGAQERLVKLARHVLKRIHQRFVDNHHKVWSEDKVAELVQREIERHLKVKPSQNELFDFLKIIKAVAKNPFNQFGLRSNEFISPPSLREKIRLVLKVKGRPLHFRDIYHQLKEFQTLKDEFLSHHWHKDYNQESIHNQLIFDPEIVLAGRGIYALKEWGYFDGDTLLLMRQLVKTAKRIHKEQLWEAVQKQKLISRTTFEIYLRRKEVFELDDPYVQLRHD